MLKALTLALGVALSLIADSVGHSKSPPKIQTPSTQPAQPPAPDQRGTDEIPFSVKIVPGERTKEQAEKEEHERKEKAIIDEKVAFETQRIADHTSWLSKFTLFLFFVAAIQAGLFVWQLLYMKKGLKDATIAANAAKQSADVAKDALVLSGETAKRQLRAYLSIELAIRDGEHQLAREFKAKITFKNCGQTPAYEGIMRISIDACAVSPASIEPASKRATFMFEMPPGNIFTATPEIDSNKLGLYDETISSFNDGKIAIYILGKADFKDAFGEDRWFKFRLRYDKGCVATGNLNIEEIKSN